MYSNVLRAPVNGHSQEKLPDTCLTSFHPWGQIKLFNPHISEPRLTFQLGCLFGSSKIITYSHALEDAVNGESKNNEEGTKGREHGGVLLLRLHQGGRGGGGGRGGRGVVVKVGGRGPRFDRGRREGRIVEAGPLENYS